MTPPTTTKPLNIEQEKQQVWHAAAFDGIRAELYEDLDNLEFFQEEQLNQEPLRLDILVIKKKPGVTLKKNFARMFKGHNIIEYKSPDDSLTIEAYLKAIGYTCLYQALRKEAGYADITLTFICTRHPRKLLEFLKRNQKRQVAEEGKVENMTYAEIDEKMERMFGLKRRIAEGEAKGFNHAIDVVKNLMRGIPPKQIAEEHGRTVEEIEQIQREILSV